jgi:hypothetical protein
VSLYTDNCGHGYAGFVIVDGTARRLLMAGLIRRRLRVRRRGCVPMGGCIGMGR